MLEGATPRGDRLRLKDRTELQTALAADDLNRAFAGVAVLLHAAGQHAAPAIAASKWKASLPVRAGAPLGGREFPVIAAPRGPLRAWQVRQILHRRE